MTLVRRLRAAGDRKGRETRTVEDLGYTDVRAVEEMTPDEVMDRIEGVTCSIAKTIMSGDGYSFAVPNRSNSNQAYIPELDRIVLKDKVTERPFVNVGSVRKTVIMTRVMELVHQMLRKGIHTTKRDMFYTDVKLFKQQGESDAVLDDMACMVGCTRTSLHVVASEKGVVVGRLKFQEDGDSIDCARMGVGGKAIPPYVDKITHIESEAEFILLVEKV